MDSDVRITDTTVTGVCTVYAKRSDGDNEFILRTIGVAALVESNLTEAVSIATGQAYVSAISQLAGIAGNAIPQVKPQKSEPRPVEKPPEVDLSSTAIPTVADDTPSVSESSLPFGPGEVIEQTSDGGIEKIEFVDNPLTAPDVVNISFGDDDNDPEYQKALEMEITIFGKLNACNGWKAGKILDEQPQAIIDFCHRNSESYNGPKYTGPRTDQKEALFTLYPEAVRRVSKAA